MHIQSIDLLKKASSVYMLCVLLFMAKGSFSQSVVLTNTPNNNCNAIPCDWDGPSILINELMISPLENDGSISGFGGISEGRGEWIELYNPDVCNPVDISCYYLGNYTHEGQGGFRLPNNIIVPPAGFAIVRGINAEPVNPSLLVQNGGKTVEIIVPEDVDMGGVCVGNGATRLWFPNIGGWFAFYDANGVPQDAVSWGPNTDDWFGAPCIPSSQGCSNAQSLPSYIDIPDHLKFYASSADAGTHIGLSIRRMPDAGDWNEVGQPTLGDCNEDCFQFDYSACTGTATVLSAPGNAPFFYQWNDPNNQVSQTALNLCPGTYTVTVTSSDGMVSMGEVIILNDEPNVSFDWNESFCLNDSQVLVEDFSPIPDASQQGFFEGPGIFQNTFSPAHAGIGVHELMYTFIDSLGCENSANTTVEVFGIPTAEVFNNQAQYCITDELTDFTFFPEPGALYGEFVTGTQFSPVLSSLGFYDLHYVYIDENSCSDTVFFTLEVIPIPEIDIFLELYYCLGDESIEIQTIPNAGGTLSINGMAGNIFSPQSLGVGIHQAYFEYTNDIGCSNQMETDFYIAPMPEYSVNLTPAEACPPVLFEFSAEYSSGSSVLWDFGNGQTSTGSILTHTYWNAGCYSPVFSVTNEFNCTSDTLLFNLVCVFQEPEAQFIFNPSEPSMYFPDVAFINQSQHAFEYLWEIQLPNSMYSSTDNNINYSFPEGVNGQYPVTLFAISEDGCIDSTMQIITIHPEVLLYAPNTFTPDGNAFNPTWFIYVEGIDVYSFELKLFNRWGELIWESRNPNYAWDGTYNGKDVPQDTYVWTITAKELISAERKYWSGHVHVLR